MKTQKIILGILAVLVLPFITGCQSRLQQSAEEFIEAYNNQDMQSIAQMAGSNFSEDLKELSENIYTDYGKLTNYKFVSTGFSSENGNKESYLIYECSTEKSDNQHFLRIDYFQKDGSGGVPYISGLHFNTNKEFIENITKYDEQASAVMDKFYDAIINGKKEDIFILLDEEAFPEDQFEDLISMMNEIEEYYGKITETFDYYTIPYIKDGKTVVKKQIECTTESGKHYEELTFVKSNDEFKIYNYRIREFKDEL
ncbi:MAG: hypothetical protein JXL97_12450 [Bacteroidales bacterium]|nr:hypothetical protein [Bacteroidales bacterium]